MKIEDIKNKIENATVALATVDKNSKPHNIAIMFAKVVEGKLVITNNFMKKTIDNIKINPNISLVFWENEGGWRIDGEAEYFDSGKWLDFIKELKENKDMPSRGAVVVNIKNVNKLCG